MKEMYGAWEIDSFTFYQVPKALFSNEKYKDLSAEAKVLYGILFDRMKLSEKNGWIDDNGNVFIYFSVDEAEKMLGRSRQKVCRDFAELVKAGLLKKKRQGCGKPAILYVLRFCEVCGSDFKEDEKHTSRGMKDKLQEVRKTDGSNTDKSYNDLSYNHPSYRDAEDEVKALIEYDCLATRGYGEVLDEIVMLMADTICGTTPTVIIGGNEYARETVRSRLFKLTAEHIEYVIDSLKKNTSEIKNMKAYMLSMLYNAPTTMNSQVTADVARFFN